MFEKLFNQKIIINGNSSFWNIQEILDQGTQKSTEIFRVWPLSSRFPRRKCKLEPRTNTLLAWLPVDSRSRRAKKKRIVSSSSVPVRAWIHNLNQVSNVSFSRKILASIFKGLDNIKKLMSSFKIYPLFVKKNSEYI